MNELVEIILDYIEKNINNRIVIDDIADYIHYDKFYMQRLFKREMKITIKEYINERKIVKSIHHLLSTDDKILKVALNNGFNSIEYYSEVFYKVTSYSPLIFRKMFTKNGLTQFHNTTDILSDYNNNHKILLKLQSRNKNVKKLSKTIKKGR